MTNDQGGPGDKRALVPSPGGLVARIAGALSTAAPSASADSGSVAIAGHNYGAIVNVNVASMTMAVERQVARELPSYLSNVVATFSQDLSGYGDAPRRTLPPEVHVKLTYNDFPDRHPVIADYVKYGNVLEATYRGVEQSNGDARRMVRRKAGAVYELELLARLDAAAVHHSHAHDFARANSVVLVQDVVRALTSELHSSTLTGSVMQETAELAISLIVADAVIECEVLERPANAAAA